MGRFVQSVIGYDTLCGQLVRDKLGAGLWGGYLGTALFQ